MVKPEHNLSQKVSRGVAWKFTLNIFSKGSGLIKTFILARLLAPDHFGLMGIAMLALSTLERFSQTGFRAALIQKKEHIEDYLNTAWVATAARNLILFLILFFCAPMVGMFFRNPEATTVIRIIAVSLVFRGFASIGTVYFEKELEFHKQFIYELSGIIASVSVGIFLAFVLRSVWALVCAMLAGSATQLVMSYIIHPYRPSLSFDLRKAKELFTFGKYLLGSSIITFLLIQADDVFVGKMLGATFLGYYQMAYKISSMPTTEVAHVVSEVVFPAYSKLQGDIARLRESYLKTLQLIAFISIPLSGGIVILAPEFTIMILGGKWMPMVPALRILAFWGAIRAIENITSSVFYAVGKPGISTKIFLAQLVLLFIFIYPLTKYWGILGASISVVVASLVPVAIGLYAVTNIIKCRLLNCLKMIFYPMVNTVVFCTFVLLIKNFTQIHLFSLLTVILVSILYYLTLSYLIDRMLSQGLIVNIKERIVSLRQERGNPYSSMTIGRGKKYEHFED